MKTLLLFLLLALPATAQDIYKRAGETITFTVDLTQVSNISSVSIYRRTTINSQAVKLTSLPTIGMTEAKFLYLMPAGTTAEYRFQAYPTQKGKVFRSGSNEIIVGRTP